MEKALFDWPIVLQYDVKVKYRLISSSSERSLKATRVCIGSTNQSNRSTPFVCFCFVRAFLFQGHTKIAPLGTICDLFDCLLPARPFISSMAVLSHSDDMLQEPLSSYNRRLHT